MSADKAKGEEASKNLESEVMSAIAGFEQILEAIPNEKGSLEALAHAYAQIGETDRAKEYLLRLADVLVTESDVDGALALKTELEAYADQDPAVGNLIGRIDDLSAMRGPETVTPRAPSVDVSTEFNMAEELSFAWTLLQANELTQEEYASVVQDLTEMCAQESIATISVFHVIENRGFNNLERIIAFVSRECGAPIIALSSFDLQNVAVASLPMDFMLRRGAMVFELIGEDALVVVMNPYDKALRNDVESITGRKCHFYTALPSEFDQALDKITDVLTEPGPSEE